ncbi:hypothetical protein WDU94_012374, partial [Cyamophila willieti]
ARPCNTDGDCSSIKYSSCARDPSTSRKLCLCPDSRTPIGNSCDQIPTALHLACEKDEQCIPHAACVLNNTVGTKVCMCRDNATEVGNICNGKIYNTSQPMLDMFIACDGVLLSCPFLLETNINYLEFVPREHTS